jgi:hypothetical protein
VLYQLSYIGSNQLSAISRQLHRMTDADHRLFSLVIVTAAMHPIVPAQPRLDREQP